MDSILELPEDIFALLIEAIQKSSSISLVVFAHVSKFCYQISRSCAFKYNIQKNLSYYEVASEGFLEILKWQFYKWNKWRAYGRNFEPTICKGAARNGHLHILTWARENGFGWDSNICLEAAINGRLDVLQWARDNNYEWKFDICTIAARHGHLEILKWARSNGYPWDFNTCASAAGHGHLEILKWLRANGCPWNVWTCKEAIGGHLGILKWACANGCKLRPITRGMARRRWPYEHF